MVGMSGFGEECTYARLERFGLDAFEQSEQRAGNAIQPELRHRRHVTVENSSEFGNITQRRALVDALPQLPDEEVELGVARLLAPQRAIVVIDRQPVLRRNVIGGLEEIEQRRTGRTIAPRGKEAVVHRVFGHHASATARDTVRNPT